MSEVLLGVLIGAGATVAGTVISGLFPLIASIRRDRKEKSERRVRSVERVTKAVGEYMVAISRGTDPGEPFRLIQEINMATIPLSDGFGNLVENIIEGLTHWSKAITDSDMDSAKKLEKRTVLATTALTRVARDEAAGSLTEERLRVAIAEVEHAMSIND